MKKPAKKAAATKPAVEPKSAAPAKSVAPAKKAAPAKKKTAAAPAAAEPSVTFITAQIDIGFGNHLTIRGDGPGLSWDDGVIMESAGSNLWTYSVPKASASLTFKVLVNDLNWNTGANFVVAPGKSITIFPTF